MEEDLNLIKKKYGEKFMHLVRELFPAILEYESFLPTLLLDNFNESHFLYDDLIKEGKIQEFKEYIYSLADLKDREITKTHKSPFQLLKEAGYTLYECKSESDIQAFRKYYAYNEELCTFWTNRLNSCYVFFAVKDNVEEVRREDFCNPKRQDEYGTSVISIQFTQSNDHSLSIKNRYNHTVDNPDATFGNNLENIIAGLTYSFEKYYGMKQKNVITEFEMSDYVRANDGKLYKYNYEINNIYYCPDNIIIKNFQVMRYPKERYIIMDYFILDLKEKTIYLFDGLIDEGVIFEIGDNLKIDIVKENDKKNVSITNGLGREFIFEINEFNQIIGFKSNDIAILGNNFLLNNQTIEKVELPNLEEVGYLFLGKNKSLKQLSLPNLRIVGNNFLNDNRNLSFLDLPNLEIVGNNFLASNSNLNCLLVPNLKSVGSNFLAQNTVLTNIYAPLLGSVGHDFCVLTRNHKKSSHLV